MVILIIIHMFFLSYCKWQLVSMKWLWHRMVFSYLEVGTLDAEAYLEMSQRFILHFFLQ